MADNLSNILVDQAFNHWLAGFIDGEGYFDIRPTKNRAFYCRFVLVLRADEKLILEEIVTRTQLGSISIRHRGRDGASPQIEWYLCTKKDCKSLVELLDAHPLRAKKKRDYELWRQAVLEWTQQVRLSNTYDWSHISSLRDEMMATRRYQEVR